MEKINVITSRTVVLPVDNIDTDQIIPARFLKSADKAGLARHLFADWRFNAAGEPKADFALNRPENANAAILVAGDNFGCGSSREHAPWALTGFGFRAVVSTSIADIFRSNALKNGLIPVEVNAATHKKLMASPGARVVVSLEEQTITLPDGYTARFPLEAFSRYCLLNGLDELDFLLSQETAIAAFEARFASTCRELP